MTNLKGILAKVAMVGLVAGAVAIAAPAKADAQVRIGVGIGVPVYGGPVYARPYPRYVGPGYGYYGPRVYGRPGYYGYERFHRGYGYRYGR